MFSVNWRSTGRMSDAQEFVKATGSLWMEWKKSSSSGELKLRYSRRLERNKSMMTDAADGIVQCCWSREERRMTEKYRRKIHGMQRYMRGSFFGQVTGTGVTGIIKVYLGS